MGRRSIGIDVGGTKILGALLAEDDPTEPIETVLVPTPRGEVAVIDAIVDVAQNLQSYADEPVAGLGVGIPGLVRHSGLFRYGANLPDVIDVDVRGRLSDRLGFDVSVENDATASCWAEFVVGAARSVGDAVLVTLGTGIGGGLVVDGRLVRGSNGFAGEPGHMIVDPNGALCVCGSPGCWEVYASGRGIGYLGRMAAADGRADHLLAAAGGVLDDISGEHVTDLFARGDRQAEAVMDEFAGWVAIGVANLVNVLDPEMVVIGGGVTDVGPRLLPPIRNAYDSLVAGGLQRRSVEITMAELGSRAGAIGAALLGLADNGERHPGFGLSS